MWAVLTQVWQPLVECGVENEARFTVARFLKLLFLRTHGYFIFLTNQAGDKA
jgi:hypothetical protein